MAARLAIASLVVCGLLVMEDPLVVAVRSRVDGSPTGRIAFDCALAIVMVAYNFASSRYVVSVTSASVMLDAMSVVDDQRSQHIAGIRIPVWRSIRLVARHLNPFDLIKWAGDRLGRSIEQVSMSARQCRFRRTAALFEDLSAVNVLGVPGASLALSTRGYPVSRVRSVRHCVLFVASWFVGARIIEWMVGRARLAPVFGDVVGAVTHAIGAVFSALTDVTRPVGLIAISALVVSVVRYSRSVERTIQQMARST